MWILGQEHSRQRELQVQESEGRVARRDVSTEQ